MAPRSPDRIPRKQVIATVQLIAISQEQIRDPRTGRLSRSKWARGIRAAGLQDLIRAHARLLYALAHGDPQEAATLASAITRTGEYFATYLDDKPATGPRTTIFMGSGQVPSQEIPPTPAGLTPAEGAFESVDESDAR